MHKLKIEGPSIWEYKQLRYHVGIHVIIVDYDYSAYWVNHRVQDFGLCDRDPFLINGSYCYNNDIKKVNEVDTHYQHRDLQHRYFAYFQTTMRFLINFGMVIHAIFLSIKAILFRRNQ